MSVWIQNYKTLPKESTVNPARIFFSAALGDYIPTPETIVTSPVLKEIRIFQNSETSYEIFINEGKWNIDTSDSKIKIRNIELNSTWTVIDPIRRNTTTFSIKFQTIFSTRFFPDQKIIEEYQIQIFPSLSNPLTLLSAQADIRRSFSTIINATMIPKSTLANKLSDNLVEIPFINISGQTLIDFSDVGNMKFTIGDKFTYYQEIPLKSKCITPKMIDKDQLKLTIFEQHCPLLVSVLKGTGNTMYEKAADIYKGEEFPGVYSTMILYGMLRYILARILYGNFDINYILNKYNKKFLRDLKSSRFCSFVEAFTDPNSKIYGYDKYFR